MNQKTGKKVTVIGSGIAGLATSVRLAIKGYQVSVYEANSYAGGKLSEIVQDGYRFDAGPSLFTMPHFVTELFELAGKNPQAYFQYEKLPIVCKYLYEDGSSFTSYTNRNALIKEFTNKFNEDEQSVEKYLKKSKEIYQITEDVFLNKSLHLLSTYINKGTLKSMMQLYKIQIFESMHQANSRYFTNEKSIQFFDRFATYNGSNPYKAPATLNVIPYLENDIGAFFPKGGMHSITLSIYKLAKSLGVEFHFNCRVDEILMQGNKANGILVDGEKIAADLVISNMDMVNTYRKLLTKHKAPETLLKQQKSSSALIFYWGIKKTFPELDLHNIFFSKNYKKEFELIEEGKEIYHDPTVYVNISSKYKADDAPANSENWFTMINVPNNQGQNWNQLIDKAKAAILEKISKTLQTDIAQYIETEAILDPVLIEEKTSSAQGALYGNSSNTTMAAFLRHPNFSRRYKHLYFCGGSVHPGGGIPLCLLSAKITADVIEKFE
ncbi:1-hydroxycarotenoid 3,4-desaturase CrtD [Chondrinema litorale]|uniref:1-hydroxycarotenoid 3,4-desaturase CrtD n=1 Tax=Chondrinema litorale TaxID=2994555 RepID=UPI00254297E5|nr:1-hydroxycarotenoid 3,4-desaturase CrtD [Chondrinema litorale]UZR94914.1 phytoene desaturase family protein [Chondrinema litorale]